MKKIYLNITHAFWRINRTFKKWILGFIFFLLNIFMLYYFIWINNTIKILIYICVLLSSLYFINIIALEIILNYYYLYKLGNKIKRIYFIFSKLYICIYSIEIISLSINIGIYESQFLKNCPYLLTGLHYNLNVERRCELYNINNNSRYLYQYICSYDSSKDFNNKLKLEENNIKKENVICVAAKNIISNNRIVDLFIRKYKYSNKYYCSRTNKPNDYSYAKPEDCNNNFKNFIFLIIFVFSILQGIFFKKYYFYIVYFKNISSVKENNLSNQKNIDIINNKNLKINENLHQKNNIIIHNKPENYNNNNLKNLSNIDNNNNTYNNLLNLNQKNTLIDDNENNNKN